ncbi:MAG: histidine kinase [Candidatus Aminicenantes bacterium]|nr:histidine kinase [Candidatus Aminicenantes bacterium]
MDPEQMKSRIASFWVLHVSGWLVFSAATLWLSYRGPWTDLRRLLPVAAPYLVGFLTCLPLRLFYRAVRFHGWPLKYSILTGVVVSFVAAHIWLGVDLTIRLFGQVPPYLQSFAAFGKVYPTLIYSRGMPLLGWTFLYLGIKTRRELMQEEERTKKATALAQTAQLQMLRYQLNPHFLFNAMNSIRALIDEDEAKARELITELSEFLRYSLDSKDYANVPLRNEIEAIQHYFAIQKKRYEDKLEVVYEIEPQAGDVPVLSFLVHPLVENAVKYGMRTSPLPLVVHLTAKVRADTLLVEVCNTGRWLEPGGREARINGGTGTGLENVRRRLENAFPNRHRFEVVEKEGRVCIKLEIRQPPGVEDEKTH